MAKFKTKREVEKQLPSKTKTHYTGEIYPEIFSHIKDSELSEDMPLDAAIMWLGSFRIGGKGVKRDKYFPKEKCPICGKKEALIPYLCGGSILTGNHTIQFYCTNCHEQFVTNDHIEYFRKIYQYIKKHKNELKQSPKFTECTKI